LSWVEPSYSDGDSRSFLTTSSNEQPHQTRSERPARHATPACPNSDCRVSLPYNSSGFEHEACHTLEALISTIKLYAKYGTIPQIAPATSPHVGKRAIADHPNGRSGAARREVASARTRASRKSRQIPFHTTARDNGRATFHWPAQPGLAVLPRSRSPFRKNDA